MKFRLLALLSLTLTLRADDRPAPPAPSFLQGKTEVEIDGKKELVDFADPATAARFKGKVVVVTEINGHREVRVVDAKDAEKLPAPFLWNEKPPLRTGPVTFLGIGAIEVPADVAAQLTLPQDTGLQIAVVLPDSPAAKAGLQESDIVQKFEDQILITPRQLAVLIANRKEGDTVKLSVIRKGAPMEITATLGKRDVPHKVESRERVANVTREIMDADKLKTLRDKVIESLGPAPNVHLDIQIDPFDTNGAELKKWLQADPRQAPASEDTGKAIRGALDKLPPEERPKVEKFLLETGILPKIPIPRKTPQAP